MSEKDIFKVEQEGHIAWFTLNNPEKRNTMGNDFFNKIGEHFVRFDEDPEVRVIVIKAEGKSFTAGLNLTAFAGLFEDAGSADAREEMRKKVLEMQEGFNKIEQCRKPIVAAVHSHCIGGGIDMLSTCDIRIATQDAVFSVRETRMGMIADLGTLQRLPYIIGHSWFKELALTGRDFTADEALQMRFISKICKNKEDLYEEAREIASSIAACSPLAVQGVKDVALYSRDHGVYPGLQYVAQKNAAAIPCEDIVEAVRAFMEKRQPVFKGK